MDCTLILSSNHWYTRHSHFMYIYHNSQILLHIHWHTDTLPSYTLSLLYAYATLLFHVLVSTYVMSLPVTLDTVVSCCFMYMSTENHDTITTCSWPTDALICYFTGYRYTDTLYTIVLTSQLHRFTGIHAIDCFCIPVAWFTAPVTWISDIWIFMYSCYIIVSRSWYW